MATATSTSSGKSEDPEDTGAEGDRGPRDTDDGRERGRMPSEVTGRLSLFDRFAEMAGHIVSRAFFFAFCVLLVVVWLPSYFLFGSADTWQLVINTATTIVTFLMVALLQNTQTRSDLAVQHKLNAIADGLADLMRVLGEEHPTLHDDCRELVDAVGLETRESADENS